MIFAFVLMSGFFNFNFIITKTNVGTNEIKRVKRLKPILGNNGHNISEYIMLNKSERRVNIIQIFNAKESGIFCSFLISFFFTLSPPTDIR